MTQNLIDDESPSGTRWVPRARVVASLVQADPGLGQDLADVLSETVDCEPTDLPGCV
jgi:hypothetical protein